MPLPERPAPEALTEEGPPRFMGLCAAVVTLWLQQPLVWLGGLAVPCGLAAVFVPPAGVRPWAAALLWTAALALAAAPLCTAAVSQWLHGRPVDPEGRALWSRLGAGYALLAPWVLLGPGSLAAALGWRGVEGVYAVLLGLLLTAPFHVLLAPALALVLTRGMAPGPALREALRLASGRTWLHLGALLTAGIPLAGGLVLLLWSLSVTLYAPGEVARKTYEIAELSAAGSLWAVTLAVLGTDAVATAPPEPDAD